MPFDIDERIAEWRKSLLDTTKRNRLIKFVAGRVGGVSLVHPKASDFWTRLICEDGRLSFPWKRDLLGLPEEIADAEHLVADFDPRQGQVEPNADEIARELTAQCLRSPKLGPNHLLTDFTDRQLAARLFRLSRTAQEAAVDHGVTTLFAAFGFLRWFESEMAAEELLAPLLLVPICLARETVESEFTLSVAEDDILPNHCLIELLRTQFQIRWPTQEECPIDADDPTCLTRYLAAVREKIKPARRWEVIESAAIGVFNFQKLAMWEDLGRNAGRLKIHPLCRAIAGDAEASISPPVGLPVAADLDRTIPPEKIVHILDADSSQHEAIEAVKLGAHLVMDGPPGTGKSQTIANIIAEALAASRTVLFVSAKTAALEVVKRRLDKCGLGDFCLELHSHKASKKQVVDELGRCLDLLGVRGLDLSPQFRQLAQDRQKLNELVAELHAPRPPLGWSAFRAHGELARLDHGGARSRIAIKDIFGKDMEYVRQGAEILAGLADCGSVVAEPNGHPWRGCKLTTFSQSARDDAEYQVGRLSDVTTPAEKAASGLVALGFVAEPVAVPSWRAGEDDARRVLAAPLFPKEWLGGDVRATATAIVQLDQAARDVRALASQLPELDPASVRNITDPASLAELAPDRERVADSATLSLRGRVESLKRIEALLQTLAETAEEMHVASRNVSGFLQASKTPNADRLDLFADVALQIAEGPPIPLYWWEPARRAGVIDAFQHGEAEERALSAQRAQLLERFVPKAIEPEALMFVVEAARQSGSFWLRLLPSWWKSKKKLQRWYRPDVPGPRRLRSDIVALERYHRRAVGIRQIIAEYTTDLLTEAGGKPAWSASIERIRAIGWLEEVGIQHTFKAMAGPRRTLNRTALADAAAELAKLCRRLRENWDTLLTLFLVPDAPAQLTRSPTDLAAWFKDEANAVRKELQALGVLVSVLAVGQDIAAAAIRIRAAQLRDLVVARSCIAAARETLQDTRSLEDLEKADHTTEGARGKQLLELVDSLSGPPGPGVVAALSDQPVRDRLTAAVRQSEAARRPFDKAWERVTGDLFDPNEVVSTHITLNKATLPEIKKWAADRALDAARLDEWARFIKVEQAAEQFGLAAIMDEVREGEIPPGEAADAFKARFIRLWLDTVHQQVPLLGSFTTEAHERLIARFSETDRLLIRATPEKLRSKLLTNPTRPIARDGAPERSEMGVLLREVNKKRRHLPLRRLFADIPSLLPRIKPCLMMSPLAVSTYLDSPELAFDLVIFDEASQVRPHDAISAIYRGSQLVVGGDPRQLPPTDFFTRTSEDGDEGEGEDGGTAPFESLLDVCLSLGLTRKPLMWHYRSRRETLIAFSNHYFYGGRLVTFPSATEASAPAITFHRVCDARFREGANPVEARKVAELVLEHARTSPNRSLGVIAFSLRQQDRILAELEVMRRQNPTLESFFSENREEPFFVKNLENVQGDERDVILLGVGYGPDESGKVAMRFGPLNRAGGERRLNVAITRSRQAMMVVSSIAAADIDLARTSAEGAKLLKAFLEYAENGPRTLPDASASSTSPPESPFEQAVADELVRRGLTIQRRIGFGGYIVDIAILDPERGNYYLLGVECDGETYRSAVTARDRDRLRRAVLEGLGWRLIRVWSTDWIRDRDKQVRRILSALDDARKPAKAPTSAALEFERVPVSHRRSSKAIEFESIESVPDAAISNAIVGSLIELGSMPVDDLVAAVGRRLGFKRTGPRIRERVTKAVNGLVVARTVLNDAERVRLAERPKP